MPGPRASHKRLLITAAAVAALLLVTVAWYVKANDEGLPTSVPS
jgi:hypothetical protein